MQAQRGKEYALLSQGGRIRAQNGEGRAGSRCGVLKTETKVVEGWDMWWKILELELWGHMGRSSGVTQSVTHIHIHSDPDSGVSRS